MQTLGLSAVSEGNIIYTDHGQIGVAEACNGLGMLYMFLAFAVGAALLVRRPAVDRALIVLSAAPIALAANVARIILTGVLHETLGQGAAHAFYHDLAGWLMMPLAVAALLAELGLLALLLVADRAAGRAAVPGDGRARPPRGGEPGSWSGRSPWPEPPGRRPPPRRGDDGAHPPDPGGAGDRGRRRDRPRPDHPSLVDAAGPPGGGRPARAGRPPTVGDWEGRPLEVEPRELAAAGVIGGVLRRYVNRQDGRAVTVLLVCGPPGPIAVHTPDICFAGIGYDVVGAQARAAVPAVPAAAGRVPDGPPGPAGRRPPGVSPDLLGLGRRGGLDGPGEPAAGVRPPAGPVQALCDLPGPRPGRAARGRRRRRVPPGVPAPGRRGPVPGPRAGGHPDARAHGAPGPDPIAIGGAQPLSAERIRP